ncbi:uncharacterized protein LOC115746367 isoform X2 [Rhodamnia argentea]|uniref:Uncharacterized protein LOC115746367 isoform X2 n=1 Tax=Rhodamnia argentea TaxID=178133 RepID=A0ABM3H2L4_9MYRT|nr:uncharacterized protein LOC115746367 isoform X2 [Rhodamnia argentea]
MVITNKGQMAKSNENPFQQLSGAAWLMIDIIGLNPRPVVEIMEEYCNPYQLDLVAPRSDVTKWKGHRSAHFGPWFVPPGLPNEPNCLIQTSNPLLSAVIHAVEDLQQVLVSSLGALLNGNKPRDLQDTGHHHFTIPYALN